MTTVRTLVHRKPQSRKDRCVLNLRILERLAGSQIGFQAVEFILVFNQQLNFC